MHRRDWKGFMLQRVVAGTGVAVVVLAAALWPAGTTSAAIGKTTTCQAYQADEAKQEKADTKLTKLLESGKWAAGKKALVSTASAGGELREAVRQVST
jgi:hypothetical protein